jgi:hypothetical protein
VAHERSPSPRFGGDAGDELTQLGSTQVPVLVDGGSLTVVKRFT